MLIQKSWPCCLAVLVLAAPVAAQEALDVDSYVGIVLRSHPRAAETRRVGELVAAERRLAGAWPDPVLGVSRGRGAGLPSRQPSGTESDYSVAQTIPWPGARSARISAADIGGRVLSKGEEAARWNLELDARLTFWRLVHTRRGLDLARRADADATAILDITTRRADLGEAREADRSRAQAERLRVELSLHTALREASAAETALRMLAVETLPQDLELRADPPSEVRPEEIEARRRALAQLSPSLQVGLAAVEREAAFAALARAERWPDLDLSWVRATELDKTSWSLALGVRVPLWNGGRAEIARAEASASLARAVLERAKLDVSLAFERAVQEAGAADDRRRWLATALVPSTRHTWDLVRLSYEEGETTLLDLLDAQRTLREAEADETAARYESAQAWIEVERICGPVGAAGEKR